MRLTLTTVLALALSGCGTTHEFFKDIEGKAYDNAAAAASKYCENADQRPLIIKRTRVEARREIRQRGENGPLAPTNPIAGLDEQTALGDGPVVIVYCVGDTVPDAVWEDLVRDWQD